MRIVLLSVCLLSTGAGCGDDPKGSEADTIGDVSDASSSDSEDTSIPSALFIREAFDCTPRPGTGVDVGTDLKKVTLTAPEAICNDGSPAVMYVRAAATPAAANDWVFHLQGGGSCGGSDCAVRWCERNEKMTSTATPAGMKGKGIMRRGPQNELGDANQVFLYYCSSDNWAGTSRDAVVGPQGETDAFRLHFMGDAIIEAALGALEDGVSSDDGTQTLPALGGNGRALWTGTSGGCQGVANTADRFAARVGGLGLSPWIVCDANFGPVVEDLPPGAALDALIAQRQLRYSLSTAHANPSRDDSCEAAHGDDPWVCEWSGYVLGNHITAAPLFVRMSLGDNTISDGYLDVGFDLADFASGVRSALLRAAAGGGLETPARSIAVYGPGCTQHVGLTNDDWFFEASIEVSGTALTFHDALVAWLDGATVVAVDTAPPTLSTCATVTDETD